MNILEMIMSHFRVYEIVPLIRHCADMPGPPDL